jgi:hypothetical protein
VVKEWRPAGGDRGAGPARAWPPTGPAGEGELPPTPGIGTPAQPGVDAGRRDGLVVPGTSAQPGELARRPSRGWRSGPRGREGFPGPAEKGCSGPARIGGAGSSWYSGQGCYALAQEGFNPARIDIIRPGKVYAGLGIYNPAQPCYLTAFQYSCTYNLIYNVYISHNKRVLWYTWGYIPDNYTYRYFSIPFCNLEKIASVP